MQHWFSWSLVVKWYALDDELVNVSFKKSRLVDAKLTSPTTLYAAVCIDSCNTYQLIIQPPKEFLCAQSNQ